MLRIFCLTLTVLGLFGCGTSYRVVDSNTVIKDEESIFVIGVSPGNYRIAVYPGSIEGDAFIQSTWRSAAVFGAAKNGYVVGRGKEGDVLAVTNFAIVDSSDAIRGQSFGACEGLKTMVFKMPAGKVLYLGDIKYNRLGDRIHGKFSNSFDTANKYINDLFPLLEGQLEQWEYQVLPIHTSCTTTITVSY
ncbi:hypothetical protein A9Q79_09815 [Methylophaga sp. 42_25_T18]|nr:hypothetical protein A9Q79_09815 [Methylophaga sp. 42_25_T18]OUR89948.1 hypothetical protein A9Q92_00090 [Methylophaga sp. 42_8_T64]